MEKAEFVNKYNQLLSRPHTFEEAFEIIKQYCKISDKSDSDIDKLFLFLKQAPFIVPEILDTSLKCLSKHYNITTLVINDRVFKAY